MKAKVMLAVLALMLSGSAMAQQRINKIVDELEQKGVDVNKVVKRDPKTKQILSTVKSFTFYSKEGKYANRLKEAFKKDAEDAVTETVSNHGNEYTLVFRDGKRRATYMLSISDKSNSKENNQIPRVYLSIDIREGGSSNFDWGTLNLDGIDSLQDHLSEYDWSKFDDAMAEWSEKFGRDMEKWGEDFSRQMEELDKDLKKSKAEKKLRKRDREKADSVVRQKKRTEAEPIARAKRS